MNCRECESKTCLTTGTLCEAVEAYLRTQGIYSDDWIRPRVSQKQCKDGFGKYREKPFSSLPRDKDGELQFRP